MQDFVVPGDPGICTWTSNIPELTSIREPLGWVGGEERRQWEIGNSIVSRAKTFTSPTWELHSTTHRAQPSFVFFLSAYLLVYKVIPYKHYSSGRGQLGGGGGSGLFTLLKSHVHDTVGEEAYFDVQ